jgi:hypothetical protein
MMSGQRFWILAAGLGVTACTTAIADFTPLDLTLAPVAATPPAAAPPAYAHDPERYGQLIVRVTYGDDAASKSLNACPEAGLDVPDWNRILSGNRQITAGFTVVTPDSQTLSIEPMTVASRSKFFGGRVCATEFHQAEYRSPLYALQPVEGRYFVVKTTAHHTVKATDEVIKLIGDSTRLLLMTQATTAPMAAAVANEASSNLRSSGEDLTSTAGVDVFLDRTEAIRPFTYTVTAGGRTIPVSITVSLVNRASLFVSGADFAARPVPPSADRVLQTPIRPPSTGQSAQDIEAYLRTAQSTAVQQIANATTVATLQAACANLDGPLRSSGMTLTDQAVARWALLVRHSSLDPAVRDQATCLRSAEPALKRAGVTLTDPPPPPPPPPTAPATGDQMRRAIDWNGSQDNLIRFFKLNSDRRDLAATLFAYPLAIGDPDSVLVRAGQTRLEHPDSWLAFDNAVGRPFFTNFGCYAAPGDDGIWRAGARVQTDQGPVDYRVTLTFISGPEGPARIHRVELTRDPAALTCR